MGIYDRDYYREQQPQHRLRGPQTIVGTLILINVVVFLADGLFTPLPPNAPPGMCGEIASVLAVKVGSLTNPLYWWQFLTYGFTHASYAGSGVPWHIVGNMLVLFFLGRDIESLYGRKEFLRLYLAMLLASSVVWAVIEKLQGASALASAVGASGAITGIVILYAWNFPRRMMLLFFVIPMPAWVLGLLVVFSDLFGAMHPGNSHTAFTAHLGGAAFASLYLWGGWNLTRLTPGWGSSGWLQSRPKLRVHDPDRRQRENQALSKEVDRILEKLHREGEESLTRKERRTLESASRQYQKKRQGPDDDTL